MLTQKQKRSVTRTLIKAYYNYRHLPYLKVCREVGIFLVKNEFEFSGSARTQWHEKNVMHQIEIPGRAQKNFKEFVFWHEFCHLFLEKTGVFEARQVGYQGEQQQYDEYGDFWDQERLCEAFADAVVLYRAGLLEIPELSFEEFFFSDATSVGYAELARFSRNRIEKYVLDAEKRQLNGDWSGLKKFLAVADRFILEAAFQPRFQCTLFEHHQCPGPRFVDEEKDFDHCYTISKDKVSWRNVFAFERRWQKIMHAVIDHQEHEQLALFPERAALDKQRIQRLLKRINQKFGPTKNPA